MVRLFCVVEVDIPGIKPEWTVFVSNKLVTSLSRRKDITLSTVIIETTNLTMPVKLKIVVGVVQPNVPIISVGNGTSLVYFLIINWHNTRYNTCSTGRDSYSI